RSRAWLGLAWLSPADGEGDRNVARLKITRVPFNGIPVRFLSYAGSPVGTPAETPLDTHVRVSYPGARLVVATGGGRGLAMRKERDRLGRRRQPGQER